MTILEKLHAIEEATVIYNIHYARAGVGFCFYEPPEGFVENNKEDFRKYLNTYHYYNTFEEAVNAEYKRLRPSKRY